MTIVTKNKGKRQLPFEETRLLYFVDNILKDFPNLNPVETENYKSKVLKSISNLNEIRAAEVTNKLIMEALNNVSRTQPDWTYVASRIYLAKMYKEAAYNRSYDSSEKYGSLIGLLKTLGEKGIYSETILKEYTKEEIKLAESFIDPTKDYLYTYAGLKTLADRYLAKDHSKRTFELPQERKIIMALVLNSKEKKSKRMEYVAEAYWALSNQYMTAATPTWSNAGKSYGQLSSCFPPETLIATEKGKKQIKDILIGEKVLTHDGTFKKVQEVFIREESEKLLGISFTGTPKEMRVTDEHPILTVANYEDSRIIQELSEGVTSNVRWVKAKDLKQKDYVVLGVAKEETSDIITELPVNDYLSSKIVEEDNMLYALKTGDSRRSIKRHLLEGNVSVQIKGVPNTVNLTYDFGKFLGLFLAEGHVIKGLKENALIPKGICFTLNKNNIEDINFLKDFISSEFSIKTSEKENDDGSHNIYVHSVLFGEFIYNLVGTGFSEKILPTLSFNYSKDVLKGILHGVFLGDGTTTKTGVKLQLTNLPLVDQLVQMMYRINLYPAHREVITASGKVAGIIELNIKNKQEENFCLAVSHSKEKIIDLINANKRQYTYSDVDGYIVKRIRDIKTYSYNGEVYNLEVEKNHTYVAEGIVVHNCFIDTVDDSLQSIYDSNTDIANLSKTGGGIGVYLGKIRSRGSDIRGFKGISSGVINWMKQLNNTAVAVDQLGTRQGSIAVYLDVWHKDINIFLEAKLNNGDERLRTHDLFLGACIPDLFMEQVEKRGDWYLFDPHEVKKIMGYALEDCYDEKRGSGTFRERYEECIQNNDLSKTKVAAIDIMKSMMKAQLETGTLFMFYRDEVNRKNPNKHAGMIYSTNLCVEIIQNMSATILTEQKLLDDGTIVSYKKSGDFVTCNLSSIHLGNAYKDDVFERLIPIQIRLLDNVIDNNSIPVLQAQKTNERYRSIGLGTFSYHHLLALKGFFWGSNEAIEFTDFLYEKINYLAIKASMELAKEKNPYPLFKGSDWDNGDYFTLREYGTGFYDDTNRFIKNEQWLQLAEDVHEYGLRNANLMAVAPNGTTSTLANGTASIDPVFNQMYYEEKKDSKIPVTVPDLSPATMLYYENAYNVSQIDSVRQNAVRQRHIDQSQSFNIYVLNDIKAKDLLEIHMTAWALGVKTSYYVRSTSIDILDCEVCQ